MTEEGGDACPVDYLGSRMVASAGTGLGVVQKPLMELYFRYRQTTNHLRAVSESRGLRVSARGLHVRQREGELVYPPAAVLFWDAVQFVTVRANKKVQCAFEPIDNDVSRNKTNLFWSMDKAYYFLQQVTHPPLFTCVLRRTSGVKALDCHVFICGSDAEALGLVAALRDVQRAHRSDEVQKSGVFGYSPFAGVRKQRETSPDPALRPARTQAERSRDPRAAGAHNSPSRPAAGHARSRSQPGRDVIASPPSHQPGVSHARVIRLTQQDFTPGPTSPPPGDIQVPAPPDYPPPEPPRSPDLPTSPQEFRHRVRSPGRRVTSPAPRESSPQALSELQRAQRIADPVTSDPGDPAGDTSGYSSGLGTGDSRTSTSSGHFIPRARSPRDRVTSPSPAPRDRVTSPSPAPRDRVTSPAPAPRRGGQRRDAASDFQQRVAARPALFQQNLCDVSSPERAAALGQGESISGVPQPTAYERHDDDDVRGQGHPEQTASMELPVSVKERAQNFEHLAQQERERRVMVPNKHPNHRPVAKVSPQKVKAKSPPTQGLYRKNSLHGSTHNIYHAEEEVPAPGSLRRAKSSHFYENQVQRQAVSQDPAANWQLVRGTEPPAHTYVNAAVTSDPRVEEKLLLSKKKDAEIASVMQNLRTVRGSGTVTPGAPSGNNFERSLGYFP